MTTYSPKFDLISFGPEVEVLTAVKSGSTEMAVYVSGINEFNLTVAQQNEDGEDEEPIFCDALYDNAEEAFRNLSRLVVEMHTAL
ncbi:hypothetical protein HGG70_05230 [Rhodobacteraceae bacterium R_SAG4]|nr:hypothetical protein [Rhodobacteraceae bacterium R_SAG4]